MILGDFTPNQNVNPLNLDKGDILDLAKEAPTLNNVIVGCGWQANDVGSDNYDLDVSAFLLDKKGKVKNPAIHVVYFKAQTQQGIWSEGDDLNGSDDGDGDCERIHVNLSEIAPDIQSILFVVNIYDAMVKRQTFGMIKNSYIRLMDEATEKELARFPLKEDAGSSTAVVFARLNRERHGWTFEAIGDTLVVKDLNQLLIRYM